MFNKSSPKYVKARESLSNEQKAIYDDLVAQYAFHTEKLYVFISALRVKTK